MCIRRWNQLISNVLPVRDKSDEEELEPAGWKTSELRELVGVGCSFVPAFERRGGGLFLRTRAKVHIYGTFIPFPSFFTLMCEHSQLLSHEQK